MGVAIGSVLSNQVAAIIVLLAFTQFVEPIARSRLPSSIFDVVGGASSCRARRPMSRQHHGSSFLAAAPGSGTAIEPPRPAGAMMVAYIVALALISRFTTFKRDISRQPTSLRRRTIRIQTRHQPTPRRGFAERHVFRQIPTLARAVGYRSSAAAA